MSIAKGPRPQPILQAGDPALEQVSVRVAWPDNNLSSIVDQLAACLQAYRAETGFGRAISAPQMGIHQRLIVMNLGAGPVALINPEITWRSQTMRWVWDDCLSVPDKIVRVQRHQSISLRYTDQKQRARLWENLPPDLSELLQHEIDHLDGVLMTQRAEKGADAIRPISDRQQLIGQERAIPRLSVANVIDAAAVIDPVFLNSPQFVNQPLSNLLGCRLTVKIETCNPIRSFKGRGADYALKKIATKLRGQSLTAASAGNWGQALAYGCRKHGLPLTVFVSRHANPLKVGAMRALGAEIRVEGEDFDAAKVAGKAHAAAIQGPFLEDGLTPGVSEGHGTIARELLASGERFDDIVVPLGNGALLNGIGLWVKARDPAVKTIGVCATAAPSMLHAWLGQKHAAARNETNRTIADGIDVREPIPEAVADMAGKVDDVLLVEDAAMREAMGLALEHIGLVLEPAGAAGLAAVLAHQSRFKDRSVAVILTGSHAMVGS